MFLLHFSDFYFFFLINRHDLLYFFLTVYAFARSFSNS